MLALSVKSYGARIKPRKQGMFLILILLLAAGATFLGVGLLRAHHGSSNSVFEGASSPPTLAHPLPAFAKQSTLSQATSDLGASVVLPNSPGLTASAAGPVWVATLTDQDTSGSETTVAVTYPAQGFVFDYTNPAPSNGSASHFQGMADGMVSPAGAQIGQVITLPGGIPALAVQQNSDETGTNFGEVIFNTGGTEVRVMGHSPEATLQSLAASILAQSSN